MLRPNSVDSRSSRDAGLALGAALLLSALVALFISTPGTSDVRIWMRWMRAMDRLGVVDGFAAARGDYPPLTFCALWVFDELAEALRWGRQSAIKLLTVLFLVGSCLVYWRTALGPAGMKRLALGGALGWSLGLAGVGLGYLDILYTPLLLLLMHSLQSGRMGWPVAVLFWSCALIKWQPLILAPFFLLFFARKFVAGQRVFALQFLGVGALGVLVCWSIFGNALVIAFQRAMSHQFLSGNAINFPWLMTHVLHLTDPGRFGPLDDGLCNYIKVSAWQFRIVPRILFVCFYGWALWRVLEPGLTFERWLRLAVAGYLAYFTFNVGVHENHLFVAAILVLYGASRKIFSAREVLMIVGALNMNLLLFYGFSGNRVEDARVLGDVDLATVAALLWVDWFVVWCVKELFSPKAFGARAGHNERANEKSTEPVLEIAK